MQNLQKQHLFCIFPGYKVPGKTSKEALHSLRAKGDIFFLLFLCLKIVFFYQSATFNSSATLAV